VSDYEVAFAPKAGVHEDQLGAIFVNDSTEVNLRELVLNSPYEDRAFIVTDPAVEAVLSTREELKRVSVPDEPAPKQRPAVKPVATKPAPGGAS
jgi:hypothetical protein